MTVNDLGDALKAVYPFRHFAWSSAPRGDYGVYAEEAGRDFVANLQHCERGTEGTIDFYTRDDSGTPKRRIEAVLNGLKIPWRLNSVQYEPDTGYIHLEWTWGIYG